MLSGQADEVSILQTVGVAHQFLAKPVAPELLKKVLGRACTLQDLMKNEQLKAIVSRLGNLPSLPAIYTELQNKLLNPECLIGEVAAIITKDMAMCAKVLQLVNSAFFGLYKNIDSPVHAVNLLGLDTIKALVLGFSVFSELKTTTSKTFPVGKLWDHSFTTAAFARKIAQAETANKQLIDTIFMAGIMHDIGKLLLFSSLHDSYIQAVVMAKEQNILLYQAEQQVFNSDHSDVGSYLLELWGLPGGVIEAIAFHHRLDIYPEPSFCPTLAVHVADVIYYELFPDRSVGEPPRLNHNYLEQAGAGERYQVWMDLCREMLL